MCSYEYCVILMNTYIEKHLRTADSYYQKIGGTAEKIEKRLEPLYSTIRGKIMHVNKKR